MSNELAERLCASPLVYRRQRAITLAMMDEVHQRPKGTAGRNFRENRDKLNEGEDYFLVPYVEWSQWVNGATKFVAPSDHGHTGPLTILAESGYLLLVKSFRDDLAWKVQRELVRGYFRAGTAAPSERRHPAELAEKISGTMERWHRLLSLGGLEERDRILLKDVSRNWMLDLAPVGSGNLLPVPLPVSIVDRCADLGHGRPKRGEDVKIGKAVAAQYRLSHDGQDPPKHTQFVEGRPTSVNSYTTADLPVIDRAIRTYFEAKAK